MRAPRAALGFDPGSNQGRSSAAAGGGAPLAGTASTASKQGQGRRRVRRRGMRGGGRGGRSGCGWGVAARPARDHTSLKLVTAKVRIIASRISAALSESNLAETAWAIRRQKSGCCDVALIFVTESLTRTSSAWFSILQANDVIIGRHTK